jgi:protocatechuate 3,4-dioxygenase beta subunit
MNNQRKVFSRRELLEMTLGIGGLTALGGSAFAQEAKRLLTPEAIVGPFYPILKPLDKDADLTRLAGNKTRAAGKIVHVTGRVVNEKGEPVKGAKIEIWQANTHGRYSHSSDPNTIAPLDPNFQGYAVLMTDAQGRYRFKTVKPGAYPATQDWMRPPHIHLDVSGKTDRLVTQMYFPDEPLNEKDQVFLDLGSYKQAAVAKLLPSTKEIESDAILLAWDIVLTKG